MCDLVPNRRKTYIFALFAIYDDRKGRCSLNKQLGHRTFTGHWVVYLIAEIAELYNIIGALTHAIC